MNVKDSHQYLNVSTPINVYYKSWQTRKSENIYVCHVIAKTLLQKVN